MERLKRETAADHAAVEGAVPLMEPGLDRETYVRYLRQIHGVVVAWETRAAAIAPDWLQAPLRARRRRAVLERDLAWFGVDSSVVDGRHAHALQVDGLGCNMRELDGVEDTRHKQLNYGAEPDRPALPEMTSEASLLGAMYVMEGSTLGGQLIARQVEKSLGLSPGQGDAYFRGHGERTGAMWMEFCEMLRTRVPDGDTEEVVNAAKSMFHVFGAWMKRTLVSPSQEIAGRDV